MSFKSFRMIGVLSLAILGICLATQPAAADQQGWPYNPPDRSWQSRSNGFSQNNQGGYIWSAPVVVPEQVRTEIQLKVPAQAKIWFDGSPTDDAGISRRYVSPPLKPGVPYHYAIRVEWRQGDRVIKRNRDISFGAGDRLNLDFTTPELTMSR
jgi:uncharacterized protein (TIGR03000 family)